MALEGTVKTPIGSMSKKTAALGVGAVGVLGLIVYYRHTQNGTGSSSTDTTASDGSGSIDPATGYVYGTPEDLAALASQGTDLTSVGGVTNTGGGSGIPSGGIGTGYVSNGQWVQATIEYMTSNGLVEDATQLSAALGKYVTGSSVDPNDVNTISLIQQAIAVQGYPPVSGPNGYPPAINTHPATSGPPVTTPPPSTPAKLATPSLKAKTGHRSVTLTWNNIPGAEVYWVYRTGVASGNGKIGGVTGHEFSLSNQEANTHQSFYIEARGHNGQVSKSNTVSVTIPK